MTLNKRIIIFVVLFFMLPVSVYAVDVCSYASVTALKTEMMVASLSCGKHIEYDTYVKKYRSVFLTADRVLKQSFNSHSSAYDRWITELANMRGVQAAKDPELYCKSAVVFLKDVVSSKDSPLVSASRFLIPYLPIGSCNK